MSRLGVTMANGDNSLDDSFSQRQISTSYSPRNQYRVVIENKTRETRQVGDRPQRRLPGSVSACRIRPASPTTALQTTLNPGVSTQVSTAIYQSSSSGTTTGTSAWCCTTSRASTTVQRSHRGRRHHLTSTNAQSSTQSAAATVPLSARFACVSRSGIGFALADGQPPGRSFPRGHDQLQPQGRDDASRTRRQCRRARRGGRRCTCRTGCTRSSAGDAQTVPAERGLSGAS